MKGNHASELLRAAITSQDGNHYEPRTYDPDKYKTWLNYLRKLQMQRRIAYKRRKRKNGN